MTPAEIARTETRARIVAEARRWLGTPYHHAADVLGAGIDCGMILVRVFVDAGLVAPFDPRPYPADFMLHRDEERYLEIIRSLASHEYDPREVSPPAGDVVVWKQGRTFSHGAIVTGAPGTASGWPYVLHAYSPAGMVEEVDVRREGRMMQLAGQPRPMRAFSYWPAGEGV